MTSHLTLRLRMHAINVAAAVALITVSASSGYADPLNPNDFQSEEMAAPPALSSQPPPSSASPPGWLKGFGGLGPYNNGKGGAELGIRVAYSAPVGNVVAGVPVTDYLSGAVPITLDFGGRIGQHVYVGVYFKYGPARVPARFTSVERFPNGEYFNQRVTGRTSGLGLTAQYHILPNFRIDPWVGLGFGRNWLTAEASSQYGTLYKDGLRGYEIELLAGFDVRVTRFFGIGPYVSVSTGQITSANSTANGYSPELPSLTRTFAGGSSAPTLTNG